MSDEQISGRMKGNSRQSLEIVFVGCQTTSEKIRKAALAGYSTAETAKALGIRYQHVYKVLGDAGLRRSKGESLPVNRPERPLPTPATALLESGFREVGEWQRANDGILPSAQAPQESGVYAFVRDGIVVYVGSTSRPLRACMYQYQRGDARQKTRARLCQLIKSALADNRKITILVATPAPSEWNGLPVSTAAGLEAGLIRLIQPEWNKALRTTRNSASKV